MATMTPTRPPLFSLPNQLTFSRLLLAFVLFALIHVEAWGSCLVVFTLAAITDWLDGWLARRRNELSDLGRNLDPLVDKVLMCGAFIFLLPYGYKKGEGGWLHPWMVTVVVGRELIITSLRSYLETLGARFGADWMGKIKMGLQCAALIAIFVVLKGPEWFGPATVRLLEWPRDGLIWAMLLATLLSGLQYVWRAAMLLRTNTA
jgi:CDP-diacylglycerol--glycerol-3-phosphate 3-phosphatidyltransferase